MINPGQLLHLSNLFTLTKNPFPYKVKHPKVLMIENRLIFIIKGELQ